ncbi:hypothetical protein D3C87_2051030 [compost metagenome]
MKSPSPKAGEVGVRPALNDGRRDTCKGQFAGQHEATRTTADDNYSMLAICHLVAPQTVD